MRNDYSDVDLENSGVSSLDGRKLGQYEVVELLSKGGMGTVYKGYQPSVDRYVAIKVLPPHPGMDDQYLQRFQLEARTIAALQHPHILPLYDYGTQDDIVYLVMMYADGGSVEDLVERAPVQPEVVERLLREIAGALDYAHRRSTVHRDIKPGNILLDSEGHALLADFGIVKMVGSGTNLTGTGIIGTPAYMSPEQAQGSDIDGRSDIYALGAMAFELLTGRPPYRGDTPMKVLLSHINNPIPNLLDYNARLTAELSRVMKKVLAKEPAARYHSAGEFAEAFTSALHGSTAAQKAVRAQYPLDAPEKTTLLDKPPIPATLVLEPLPSSTPAQPQPTVIIRESTSPLVLLGGFALLALGIVIVAVLLIGQLNRGNPVAVITPSPDLPDIAPASTVTIQPLIAAPNSGELRFSTANSPGDSLTLRVTGLKDPPPDAKYATWLVNTGTGETLLLGEIVKDAFGDGTLLYTDADGRMLPAWYNAIRITAETTPGETPTGAVAYSGSVPLAVSGSLLAIFVRSDDGIEGGSLMEGAAIEAQFGFQHSGLAAQATTLGGMKIHAEHTINILRGAKDDLDGDGRGNNPARGFGVYFFLQHIEAHVQAAATSPGATLEVQSNAELIRVCTQNARQWADSVQQLEAQLLAAEMLDSVAAQAQQSTEHMNTLINGFDANQNGQIEPFEGECGLAQIPGFGVLFGNIVLHEGDLNGDLNNEE